MDTQVKTKTGALALLYFVFTIGLVGLIFAFCLSLPLFALGKFYPASRKAGDSVLGLGIAVLMRVQPWFSAEIDFSSRNELPDSFRGCLLISNHRSHLDTFILLSRIPGIRVLAKSSLFRIPFLGVMMRASGQISARRGDVNSLMQAMEEVKVKLKHGETVHIFPEMTRCSPGFRGTQNFLLAPFHAAFQTQSPVVPIVFQGTDDVWPKGRWGISFRKPIVVRSLQAVDPREFDSVADLRNEVQRRINQVLEA